MTNCLGLYIEENLIKYAKVSKDHDKIKVESFGIKFYDKLGDAIDQVIEETYSQKTPISINLSEEMYNYFDMFALLSKNDLQKAINTEFEAFCVDKGYNPNVFESRYAIFNSRTEKDKIKVIHVAENKIELNKRIQQTKGYKLANIAPISMAIPSLLDVTKKENSMIINIEEKTTVTRIIENKVYHIDVFEEGSTDILSKINLKENSYSKSYEICKNTTIYTSEGKSLLEEETSYLEDIMPTLYDIVGKVRKIINESTEKIEKIYLTGTGALINNVDLYFQEYLEDMNCEILRPYFVQNTKDITIKDYIEVNSAISLAMMGLGEGINGMNFKKQTFSDKVPDWMKIEVNPDVAPKDKKNLGGFLTWDLGQKLDNTEISLVRTAVGLLLLIVIYTCFSGLLANQMNKKRQEAQESINSTNQQIAIANSDNEKIKTKINEYTTMIKNLEEANDRITDRNRTRNAIPNLLNQIMSIVPENVQLTSIENTTGTHVVINAQSNKYEQLGYLKAKIKADVILTNVISTAGQKDNNVVTVMIEGDLP
ncbi:MAG: hypothetical protein HFJ40_07290 [Clostridia bacterium]|nr:hypothetical protein [Clostridia bacterium]